MCTSSKTSGGRTHRIYNYKQTEQTEVRQTEGRGRWVSAAAEDAEERGQIERKRTKGKLRVVISWGQLKSDNSF